MPEEVHGFEIVEHTADVGIRATGADLPELFGNVARGMCSIVADLNTVEAAQPIEVQASGDDYEDLMVHWLNEVLYMMEVDRFLFCDFKVRSVTESKVEAEAWGEKIDSSRHELGTEVKAATYHELSVKKPNGGWSAFVLLDI